MGRVSSFVFGVDKVMTQAEVDAWYAKEAARKAAHQLKRANSAPARLRALAVGDSHLFTQYRLSSQLSPAIAAAKLSGATFTSSRELDLVNGECVGIRVTRTS